MTYEMLSASKVKPRAGGYLDTIRGLPVKLERKRMEQIQVEWSLSDSQTSPQVQSIGLNVVYKAIVEFR